MNSPTALRLELSGIPQSLRAIPRWLLWRYTLRNGKYIKMPLTVFNRAASTNKQETWTTFEDVKQAFLGKDYSGLGLVIDGSDFCGIDLDDCRDPDTGELSNLAKEVLERVQGYAEVSPSCTGIKIFTISNLAQSHSKTGVELYKNGRYFAVTGHVLDSHTDLPLIRQDLDWLVEREFGQPSSRGEDAGKALADSAVDVSAVGMAVVDANPMAMFNYKTPLPDWPLTRVEAELLPLLDPDGTYDSWLEVGFALHHQGMGEDAWLEAWDTWSMSSSRWLDGECENKWRSFKRKRVGGRGPLSLASLLAQTKKQRGAAMDSKRDVLMAEIRAEIAACTDAGHLQKEVAVKISNTLELSDVQREQLVIMIQAKSKDLGAKLPINTVRAWVQSRAPRNNLSLPDWACDWVYITEGDKFFNIKNKHQVSSQGFCAMFNRNMPSNPNGARFRADRYCTDQCGMPVVSHKGYVPVSGPIFEMFGLKWVNTYRPDSVPDVPDDFTVENLKAIEAVQRHLTTYLAEPRERELLLSWIAHNVKYPGVKIRWAPYVHGVPGAGKSFFSDLLAAAMGGQNVRMLNGSTLESNFTDWAVGHAVVSIEEMKNHGRNRYDTMNRIKPVITNDSIEIHPKGLASYTAPNFSNYIIFSNYLDGAPIDESDRRYMFLSSQLTTDQVKAMNEAGYFKSLFEALEHHPGAIRKWLLGYELHHEFNANGRAPETSIKSTVIEMSKGHLEIIAQTIIEENDTLGVTPDVISSAHLMRAVSRLDANIPATSQVNSLLTRLGFQLAMPKQKKWDGQPCRIWVRKGLELSEVEMIKRLDESMVDFLK